MLFSRILVILLAISFLAKAQPVDNPYKSKYGGVGHWTDSLAWSQVNNVLTFGAIADDNLDDSAAVQSAINQVHANGGGVVFFPAGTYNISGHLKIKTGVILRGENPTGVLSAKEAGYRPASKLVFPRFLLDTTANNGAGNDRKKAFKSIKGDYDCSNAGIVNLDINRAYIGFQPQFNANPGSPFVAAQPIQENRNIIVMGVRSNNAVILDANIPILGTPVGSKQREWQVFPWRFSSNIDIYVNKNCVIANNRLNDGPADNFEMPNFKIKRRGTENWITLGLRTIGSGWKADFDYNAHYGISLNRAKLYKDSNGTYKIHGGATYANPENEPYLFRTGFEIKDNWIYKTSRVGITAAGIGLLIKGNVLRDSPQKEQQAFENFTGPTANQTPQGATTMENRCIDFSGWQVVIDSNDVEAYKNYVSGYLTTDGEGILLQECCGGTQVNDYTISNNNTKNNIAIYKMRDINNLKILNNNMNGNGFFIVANTNSDAYYLNNFLVEGNTNVSDIFASGTRGGFAGYIRNNTGTGTAAVGLSCHVNFENNNSGFGNVTYRAVDPNNLANHTPPVVSGPCAESTIYPKVEIVQPQADTTFEDNLTQYTLKARLKQGDLFTAKIDFLLGTDVVAQDLTVNPFDSVATYVWNVPTNATNITAFTARVRDGGLTSFSTVRKFTRIVPVVSIGHLSYTQGGVHVYPNPVEAGSTLQVQIDDSRTNPTFFLFDLAGKKLNLSQAQIIGQQTFSLDISSNPQGIYLLKIESKEGSQVVRVIRK